MDRDRLRAWLDSTHYTERWRFDEDYDRYEGFTTCDEGLRWFLWSHVPGEDGAHDERLQTWDELDRDGPLRALPEAVARKLHEWRGERQRSTK